ncbi:MAG: hypothetical protein ACRD1G_07320, partial [Acidimicrobiales bacterium]
MPTRRGWQLASGGAISLVFGRLLGLPELFILAAAAELAVVASYIYVRLASFSVEAHRTVQPDRIFTGGSSR